MVSVSWPRRAANLEAKMQHTIYTADELVLEAHPEGPYILLRREGEPGTVGYISTKCATWRMRCARWRRRWRGW
jgi:hypothetical protein